MPQARRGDGEVSPCGDRPGPRPWCGLDEPSLAAVAEAPPRPARTGSAVRNPATFCVSLPLAFRMALSLSLRHVDSLEDPAGLPAGSRTSDPPAAWSSGLLRAGSAPAIQGRVRMGRLETPAVFCPHAKPGDVRACRAGPLEPTGLRPTPRPPLFLLTDGRSKWPVEQEGLVYPGRGRLG